VERGQAKRALSATHTRGTQIPVSNEPAGPPSPLATAEPWDLVAAAYAEDALPYFESFARDALSLAALPADARIVDVAAGPGTLSLLAAAAGARVSAIDISPGMVDQFRARAAEAGLSSSIDVHIGDGQQLPFETGAYDGAFSMFGLMFFPDRAAGLREMRRVLCPGAPAVVSSWVPFEGPFGAVFEAAHELLPELPLGGGRFPLSSPEEVREELSAAGLREVRVEISTQQLKAASFDAFWHVMERTNAPLALIRRRVGERWQKLMPKIRDRVHAVVGDGPLVIGRGAYLGIGVA
jgi:ubiquinone/menaquinone biosynthesis C-methylase UbiE